MQTVKWEDQFHTWSGPSSNTEGEKRDRTENAIREAMENSSELSDREVRVFAKGSYKSNTNVRLDSDVDVAVECREFFYSELTGQVSDWSKGELGISAYTGTYTSEQFKNEVQSALIDQFGSSAVNPGNKAIQVRESSSSLAADVVPCFEYRLYYDMWDFQPLWYEGTQIRPRSGPPIVNWPKQTYENGTAKNNATGRRYKKVVRILKRLENNMVEEGIIEEVPSFLIECLVYNVPNEAFNHDTYLADVQYVLAHLFNETRNGGEGDDWVEVNELKWLFHPTQKWTRAQAHNFASEAWDHVGFE